MVRTLAASSPLKVVLRLFSDPKWLIGTIIAAVAAVGTIVPLWLNRPGKNITLGPPVATRTTYAGALATVGANPGDTDPAALRQPGVLVSAEATAKGYDGQHLLVRCTLVNDRTYAVSQDEHPYLAKETPETTQPCWLPLHGSLRDPYSVQVRIVDGDGNELRVSQASSNS
jgi:hypothetical protein